MKHLVSSVLALASLFACGQERPSDLKAQGYEPPSPLFYPSTGTDDTRVVYLNAIGSYSCRGQGSVHAPRLEVAINSDATLVVTLHPSSGGPAATTLSTTYELFTGTLRIDRDPQQFDLPTQTEIFQAKVPEYSDQYKALFTALAADVSFCVEGMHGVAGPQELAPMASYLEGVQL